MLKVIEINEELTQKLSDDIDEIREAKDELVRLSNDKEQRILYEMRSKTLKDKNSDLNEAERKGIEKGIETVAKNLLQLDRPIDKIIMVTGLCENEIINLIK